MRWGLILNHDDATINESCVERPEGNGAAARSGYTYHPIKPYEIRVHDASEQSVESLTCVSASGRIRQTTCPSEQRLPWPLAVDDCVQDPPRSKLHSSGFSERCRKPS